MLEIKDLHGPFSPFQVVSCESGSRSFVAVGRNVFEYSNNSLKAWTTLADDVKGIVSNSTGTQLAVWTTDYANVYNLDGAMQFQHKATDKVLKAIWHPLGIDDTCLVVLDVNNICLLYPSPEGLVTENLQFNSRAFSAEEGPQDAITFCLDELMTLFLSTTSGSVFGICPFLPKQFQISKPAFSDLLDLAASAQHDHRYQSQSLYTQQLEWVSSLENNIEESVYVNGILHYIINRSSSQNVLPQGPFIMTPYPQLLYNCDFQDIQYLKVQQLHFLVQSSNSAVAFFLFDHPTPAAWQGSRVPDQVLTLVQAVKLNSTISSSTIQVSGDFICIQAPESTFVLDPQFISQLLVAASEDDAGIPKLDPTKVTCLPKSIISTRALDTLALPVESLSESRKFKHASQFDVAPLETKGPSPNLKSSYGTDLVQQIQALLDQISFAPVSAAPGFVNADLGSLEKLESLSEFYGDQLLKLSKCIAMGADLLQLQKLEISAQLANIDDLGTTIKKVTKNDYKERVLRVSTRQNKIRNRLAALEERLNDKALPIQPIGIKERQWYTSLDKLEKQLGSLDTRTASLGQGLNNLRKGSVRVDKVPPFMYRKIKAQELELRELKKTLVYYDKACKSA